MIDDEIGRARKLLETLVKISGLNRQEVDGRLGQGKGYASQVLTGRVELKYRHIVSFLAVVDIDPGMFFRVLFPDPPHSPNSPNFPTAPEPRETGGRLAERLFRQLHRSGQDERPGDFAAPPAAPATPATIDPEMLERRIREAIREVLGGGVPPTGPVRRDR